MTRWKLELPVALALVLMSLILTLSTNRLTAIALRPASDTPVVNDGVWFGAEAVDTVNRLTVPEIEQTQTARYPLSALWLRLPARLLMRAAPALGGSELLGYLTAIAGAIWVGALFLILRTCGHGLADAALVTLMAMASASFVFAFAAPSMLAFAAVTTLPSLTLVSISRTRPPADSHIVIAAAVSAALNPANAGFGVVAALVLRDWRRAVQIVGNAVAIVLVMWSLQHLIFRTSVFPLLLQEQQAQTTDPVTAYRHRRVAIAASTVMHSVVVPGIGVASSKGDRSGPIVALGGVPPGWRGVVTVAGMLVWTALLAIGLWALTRHSADTRLRVFAWSALATHVTLASTIGPEPLIQAVSILPVMVVIAAAGLWWRPRAVRVLSAVMLVLAILINLWALRDAIELASALTS